jgi:hypothetical protein
VGIDSSLPGVGIESSLPGVGIESSLPGVGIEASLPGVGIESSLPGVDVDFSATLAMYASTKSVRSVLRVRPLTLTTEDVSIPPVDGMSEDIKSPTDVAGVTPIILTPDILTSCYIFKMTLTLVLHVTAGKETHFQS